MPGLDFFLVVAASAAVLVVNLQASHPQAIFALAAPVLYLVLSPLLAGSDLPSAAGRSYLLCFLTSLVTLVAGISKLTTQLSLLTTDSVEPQAAQHLMVAGIAELLPNLLMPLGLGVIIYAASSVFEKQGTTKTEDHAGLIDQITHWFESHGASESLLNYLRSVLQVAQQLEGACQLLTNQAAQTGQGLSNMNQAAESSRHAIESVTSQTSKLDHSLKSLEGDLVRVSASVDQLQSAVSQMSHVVDEISEIISKKILEL